MPLVQLCIFDVADMYVCRLWMQMPFELPLVASLMWFDGGNNLHRLGELFFALTLCS
jgi:hypothetical protein